MLAVLLAFGRLLCMSMLQYTTTIHTQETSRLSVACEEQVDGYSQL